MPSHTKSRSFPPGARKYIGGLAEDSAPESEGEGGEAAEVKYTRNPTPETRNSAPETRDQKSGTRNLEPEIRDPEPKARNQKPEF